MSAGGEVDVRLGGWRIRLALVDEIRALGAAARAQRLRTARNVWTWEVSAPHGTIWDGVRKYRREAWEDALAKIPKDVLLEHWQDLPAVPQNAAS